MNITLTPEQVELVKALAFKEMHVQANRQARKHQRKVDAANERTVDWKTRALKYRKELLEARIELDNLRQRLN